MYTCNTHTHSQSTVTLAVHAPRVNHCTRSVHLKTTTLGLALQLLLSLELHTNWCHSDVFKIYSYNNVRYGCPLVLPLILWVPHWQHTGIHIQLHVQTPILYTRCTYNQHHLVSINGVKHIEWIPLWVRRSACHRFKYTQSPKATIEQVE